jgi:hypothetical protein
MRLRFIASVVFAFLLLSTLEAFGGWWLAGRWVISSRYAALSLGVVKSWLDRGLINSATRTVKVFVRKHGKWILLTLALSEIIPEVQQKLQSSASCYLPVSFNFWLYQGSVVSCNCAGSHVTKYFSATSNCPYGTTAYLYQGLRVYEYRSGRWVEAALIPMWGEYPVKDSRGNIVCTFRVEQKVFNVCSDLSSPPSTDWQSERRHVPVQVFPNVDDFIRSDVVSRDPALSWLRDEYQRIASDSSIPLIPSDALNGVELPSVDWSIPSEEAVDGVSSSEGQRGGEGQGEGGISVPGLDTKLDPVQRRPFPVELIERLVQNHPLLRILKSFSLDVGGGGSCVIGSEPFTIDMCRWQWVLNLMGSFLVPLAFLYGLLGIGGRSEE